MILFVTATRREMKSFVREGWLAGILHNHGKIEQFRGTDIGFLICGVGPLNAAVNITRYLENNQQTRYVVNVGIAGSYDLQILPLASVCLAGLEIWPEYGVRTEYCFADPEKLGFPLDEKGGEVVWNSLRLETSDFTQKTGLCLDPDWHEGVSITLAGVSSSPDQARQFKTHFNGDMENMEGFALAYCCRLKSVPFAEIRSISNLAGSRSKAEWDFGGAFEALGSMWSRLWGYKLS